mmetsp:Transcript_10280/g.23153  ORF Transcript_10280/g.23153 Transcript_10280/m.23153 type:complete len:235 (+) Transcript_10280:270-974(+)
MDDFLDSPLGILLILRHGGETRVDEVDRLLTAENVENSIASHEEEIVLWRQLYHTDLRFGDHNGLAITRSSPGLVILVAKGAGHSQAAHHSAEGHKAPRSLDPLCFILSVGLVVQGELDCFSLAAQQGPTVSDVRAPDPAAHDTSNHSRTPRATVDILQGLRHVQELSVGFPEALHKAIMHVLVHLSRFVKTSSRMQRCNDVDVEALAHEGDAVTSTVAIVDPEKGTVPPIGSG